MSDTNKVGPLVIHGAERTNNSVNGNPGWRFFTSEGTFHLQKDASLGYAVENFTFSEWKNRYPDMHPNMVIGNPANPEVTLHVTSRGRKVCYIERDGEVLH